MLMINSVTIRYLFTLAKIVIFELDNLGINYQYVDSGIFGFAALQISRDDYNLLSLGRKHCRFYKMDKDLDIIGLNL
jgi:hypothetical protein